MVTLQGFPQLTVLNESDYQFDPYGASKTNIDLMGMKLHGDSRDLIWHMLGHSLKDSEYNDRFAIFHPFSFCALDQERIEELGKNAAHEFDLNMRGSKAADGFFYVA